MAKENNIRLSFPGAFVSSSARSRPSRGGLIWLALREYYVRRRTAGEANPSVRLETILGFAHNFVYSRGRKPVWNEKQEIIGWEIVDPEEVEDPAVLIPPAAEDAAKLRAILKLPAETPLPPIFEIGLSKPVSGLESWRAGIIAALTGFGALTMARFRKGKTHLIPKIDARRVGSLAVTAAGREHLTAAATYFNEGILIPPADRSGGGVLAPINWAKAIRLFELFRGDEVGKKDMFGHTYSEEIRQKRIESAQLIANPDRLGMDLMAMANARYTDKNALCAAAAKLYITMVANEYKIFIELPGFDKGFDFSDVGSAKDGDNLGTPASGHHRLAWFLMNYLLINNGCEPFYFERGECGRNGKFGIATFKDHPELVAPAAKELARLIDERTARGAAGPKLPGGFIGCYEPDPANPPRYDEASGKLSGLLVDSEASRTADLGQSLEIRPITKEELTANLGRIKADIKNPMVKEVIGVYENNFNGNAVIFDHPSDPTISFGSDSLIIVSDVLIDKPGAVFHEIGHAAACLDPTLLGRIEAYLLQEAPDKLELMLKKAGPDASFDRRAHYVLRALQWHAFPKLDRQFTSWIKKWRELTRPESEGGLGIKKKNLMHYEAVYNHSLETILSRWGIITAPESEGGLAMPEDVLRSHLRLLEYPSEKLLYRWRKLTDPEDMGGLNISKYIFYAEPLLLTYDFDAWILPAWKKLTDPESANGLNIAKDRVRKARNVARLLHLGAQKIGERVEKLTLPADKGGCGIKESCIHRSPGILETDPEVILAGIKRWSAPESEGGLDIPPQMLCNHPELVEMTSETILSKWRGLTQPESEGGLGLPKEKVRRCPMLLEGDIRGNIAPTYYYLRNIAGIESSRIHSSIALLMSSLNGRIRPRTLFLILNGFDVSYSSITAVSDEDFLGRLEKADSKGKYQQFLKGYKENEARLKNIEKDIARFIPESQDRKAGIKQLQADMTWVRVYFDDFSLADKQGLTDKAKTCSERLVGHIDGMLGRVAIPTEEKARIRGDILKLCAPATPPSASAISHVSIIIITILVVAVLLMPSLGANWPGGGFDLGGVLSMIAFIAGLGALGGLATAKFGFDAKRLLSIMLKTSDENTFMEANRELNKLLYDTAFRQDYRDELMPYLRKVAVSPEKAIDGLKRTKKFAWIVKLPMSRSELVEVIDSNTERNMDIHSDELGNLYLYLARGVEVTARSSEGRLRVRNAGSVIGLSAKCRMHCHSRFYDTTPSAGDEYIRKHFPDTPLAILAYQGLDEIKLCLSRARDKEFQDIRPEYVDDELVKFGILQKKGTASSAISHFNSFVLAPLALAAYYLLGTDTQFSPQVLAILAAIYATSFLIHEFVHWASTGFTRFAPKELFTKEGISIPGATGLPGIIASASLAIISALFIIAIPRYAFPALIINVSFALSWGDWRAMLGLNPSKAGTWWDRIKINLSLAFRSKDTLYRYYRKDYDDTIRAMLDHSVNAKTMKTVLNNAVTPHYWRHMSIEEELPWVLNAIRTMLAGGIDIDNIQKILFEKLPETYDSSHYYVDTLLRVISSGFVSRLEQCGISHRRSIRILFDTALNHYGALSESAEAIIKIAEGDYITRMAAHNIPKKNAEKFLLEKIPGKYDKQSIAVAGCAVRMVESGLDISDIEKLLTETIPNKYKNGYLDDKVKAVRVATELAESKFPERAKQAGMSESDMRYLFFDLLISRQTGDVALELAGMGVAQQLIEHGASQEQVRDILYRKVLTNDRDTAVQLAELILIMIKEDMPIKDISRMVEKVYNLTFKVSVIKNILEIAKSGFINHLVNKGIPRGWARKILFELIIGRSGDLVDHEKAHADAILKIADEGILEKLQTYGMSESEAGELLFENIISEHHHDSYEVAEAVLLLLKSETGNDAIKTILEEYPYFKIIRAISYMVEAGVSLDHARSFIDAILNMKTEEDGFKTAYWDFAKSDVIEAAGKMVRHGMPMRRVSRLLRKDLPRAHSYYGDAGDVAKALGSIVDTGIIETFVSLGADRGIGRSGEHANRERYAL